MNKFLAEVIHDLWAMQFEPEPDDSMRLAYSTYVTMMRPHTVAPMVPETFRGPKWGTR